MDSIRVDSGIKKIEVNDDGECISIPISDTAFYERFANILKYFDEKQKDIEQKVHEISEKYSDNENTEKAFDEVKMYSDLCRNVCSELDKLFGEGCCRKVFVGNEVPGIELIGDFFEQITPILQRFVQERNKKIELRYNRHRKGAHSE